jgi:hypothetical protein
MLGRIQIEANNIIQLGSELRIAANLEAFDTMRFESVCMPDAPHAGLRDTGLTGHYARGPLGSIGRRRPRGLGNDFGYRFCRNSGRAPGPRRVFKQALDAER